MKAKKVSEPRKTYQSGDIVEGTIQMPNDRKISSGWWYCVIHDPGDIWVYVKIPGVQFGYPILAKDIRPIQRSKTMKPSDWYGKRVELLSDHKSPTGITHHAGSVFTVVSGNDVTKWLTLENTEPCRHCGCREQWISMVPMDRVRLLEDNPEPGSTDDTGEPIF